MNERTENAIKWANNYINYFKKNFTLDPFQVLTGERDKQHELYCACVELIATIETAAETFREERDKIAL